MSDEGRVMPVQVVENTTLGEVTPQRGKGALGTVMAMLVTPQGTLSPTVVVNGADG